VSSSLDQKFKQWIVIDQKHVNMYRNDKRYNNHGNESTKKKSSP